MHATSLRPVRGLTYSFDAPILQKKRSLIPIPPLPSSSRPERLLLPIRQCAEVGGQGRQTGHALACLAILLRQRAEQHLLVEHTGLPRAQLPLAGNQLALELLRPKIGLLFAHIT